MNLIEDITKIFKKKDTKSEDLTTVKSDIVVDNPDQLKEMNSDDRLKLSRYQEKYRYQHYQKTNKFILVVLLVSIFILGLAVFSQITVNVYQINNLVGIVVGVILLAAYLFIVIFFSVRLFKAESFQNMIDDNTSQYKRRLYNEKLLYSIAKHIVSLDEQSQAFIVYKKRADNGLALQIDEIAQLKEIVYSKPNKENKNKLKLQLDTMFSKDGIIFKTARNTIIRNSVECGALTSISQNGVLDATLVAMKSIQMITDIVYIYGFRPNDYQLNRMMIAIVKNTCLAYGLNDIPLGNSVEKIFKNVDNTIVNILSNIISASLAFIINGTLIYSLGRQTISYLIEEYSIAKILDCDTSLLELEACSQNVKAELKKEIEKKKNDLNQ